MSTSSHKAILAFQKRHNSAKFVLCVLLCLRRLKSGIQWVSFNSGKLQIQAHCDSTSSLQQVMEARAAAWRAHTAGLRQTYAQTWQMAGFRRMMLPPLGRRCFQALKYSTAWPHSYSSRVDRMEEFQLLLVVQAFGYCHCCLFAISS